MTWWRWGTTGLLAAVASSTCADGREPAGVHEPVRAYFEPHGIVPDAVRCPDRPAPEVGRVTACEVSIDGESVEVEVEVVSEHAPARVRPRRPTLITAEVEQEIAASLRERGHPVERVRCPGRLWVVRPQLQRRCAVELADGPGLWWVGTFSGDGSAHRAEVTPRTAEDEALP